MKRLRVFMAFLLLLALASCSSVPDPRRAYDGEEKPRERLANFFMAGDGSVKILLFKVDKRTCGELRQFAFTYNAYGGGFNVSVLPGRHEFELVFVAEKEVRTVAFSLEAGADYELRSEGNSLRVAKKTASGDVPEEAEFAVLPPYMEPDPGEPHALLVQNEETKKEGGCVIFRIDGLPGTDFPQAGRNLFVARGNFELRLAPGTHRIEYVAGYNRYASYRVYAKEFTAEAGRKYRFKATKLEKVDESLALLEIDIVTY